MLDLGRLRAHLVYLVHAEIHEFIGISDLRLAQQLGVESRDSLVAALCERMERGSKRGLERAISEAEGFVAELAEAVGEVRKEPPAGGS